MAMLGVRIKYRASIRRLAVVTAFALCSAALHASHHWDDSSCAEDACAACLFTDSGSAAKSVTAFALTQAADPAAVPSLRPLFLVSRPRDAHRTRAPPISWSHYI